MFLPLGSHIDFAMTAKRVSVTQTVYAELRRRILAEELLEGEPVRQDEVAAELGISKIPVREALMRLQSEGLVSFIPNAGASVSRLSLEDYVEMLDVRIALEGRALELAIPNMASTDLDAPQRSSRPTTAAWRRAYGAS